VRPQPIRPFSPKSRAIGALLSALVALCCALCLGACGKRDAAPNPVTREVYARGDRVLVEQAAARFFEGRVLAVEGEHLRVQAVGGNDPVSVATSDVYRLPPAAHELAPNQLAVCGRSNRWLPCRVREVRASSAIAWSASGEHFEVARELVLAPSSLTELNLKRYFERQEAVRGFEQGAKRAGDPRPEPSWRPTVHERLLVKLGGEWFTGYVRELGEDGAQVSLNAAQKSATVPLSALSAEPPSSFVSELRRGDFVLLRPETLSQPWARREVHAVNGIEITLSDAAGTLRSASVREVVPLRP
jgi:hypothetical protein